MDKAGIDVAIFGGGAGEPVKLFRNCFYKSIAKIMIPVLLSLIVDEDKVEVNGVAVSGWKPVGTEKRITKCEGNWVYTIDDEPALDVIKKFLGKDIILNNKAEGIDSFPLQVQRVKGKPMMLANCTTME
ncbi:MAG: hypothetical protein IPQ27_10285 [Chitinophagaceae bacterium]|nr:hypothetical protein [Chitinophagaceae bacterium]